MFFSRSLQPISGIRVHRLLLIQFESVSEVVYGLPMLIALRMRYPHAQIAWLTDEKGASVLKGHWALDRLMIVKNQWITSCADTISLRRRLMNFAPEVTVDMQNLFRSSFAAWISGAKYRIGASGSGRSLWLNNCEVVLDGNEENALERNFRLLEPFAIEGCSIDFDVPFSEMDRIIARDILQRSGLRGNYAILALGEKNESEFWPKERFAAVSDYLLDQWNLPTLVVWSDPQSWKFAEEIVHCAQRSAVLCAPVSLSEITELTRSGTLLIAPNSSALHLSASVGTPCLGLNFPTNAANSQLYGMDNRFVEIADSGEESETELFAACDEILTSLLSPLSFEDALEKRRRETVPTRSARAA